MGKQGRRLALGGALALLVVGGGTAHAMTLPVGWQIFEGSGARTLAIDPGVTSIRFVAIGGTGGGVRGGRGAIVAGELPVAGGQLLRLRVGGDGGVLHDALAVGTTSAGSGGRESSISLCSSERTRCLVGVQAQPLVVAGGGGGAGGGSALFAGGAGGDAGAAGADGVEGALPGAAGRGGSAAPLATGGAGGAIPGACVGRTHGEDGRPGSGASGGSGGYASDPAREGGAGGDGVAGGGGGGSAATCGADQGGGSGGGAGGTSLVPAGATFGLSEPGSSGGSAQVRYFLVKETTAPTITVSAPLDGGRYVARTSVAAAYSCLDEPSGSGLESCVGTVASGQPIDTGTPGVKTFTVTARDRFGNAATTTVSYTVTAPPPPPVVAPKVSGVAATARALRFTLSAPARVTLRVERRKPGRRARWRHVGTVRVNGRSGANTVALRGRVGRRKLTAGSYRVVIVATADGKRSKPITRTFKVRARR